MLDLCAQIAKEEINFTFVPTDIHFFSDCLIDFYMVNQNKQFSLSNKACLQNVYTQPDKVKNICNRFRVKVRDTKVPKISLSTNQILDFISQQKL